jgi:UTP--glucose-1-phosphate uridylyltransferase
MGRVVSGMRVTKALITAAGKNQRTLPLQTLVDRDGESRTALAVIVEEALAAGIEEIGVVIPPEDQSAFAAAAGPHAARLEFVEQHQPRGYGHAVWCGRKFTGDSPFLLLVGDHVYVSTTGAGCARQLVGVASQQACSLSAVQATHESKLPYFGAVGGRRVAGQSGLYEVAEVLEKPTPTEAEQRLIVPGLRSGRYLCFFGMHVLTPTIMELIEKRLGTGSDAVVHLSSALADLARGERYLAFEASGQRYDIGSKYGLLTAQLALALSGEDRGEVLESLVELLAQTRPRTGAESNSPGGG